MAVHAGGEGFALIGDFDGLVGSEFAAVPEVALVLLEEGGGRGDEDAVGGLFLGALGGAEGPTESGRVGVDGDGVGEIFAAEVFDAEVGRCGVQVGGGEGKRQV